MDSQVTQTTEWLGVTSSIIIFLCSSVLIASGVKFIVCYLIGKRPQQRVLDLLIDLFSFHNFYLLLLCFYPFRAVVYPNVCRRLD